MRIQWEHGGYAVRVDPPKTRAANLGRLAADLWIEVEGADLPQAILVRLGKSPEGALVCTGLLIGKTKQEVTARGLRAIRLPEVLEAIAVGMASFRKGLPRSEPGVPREFYRAVGEFFLSPEPEEVRRPKLRPGPKGHPREWIEQVARDYRLALEEHPRSPIKALGERHHASEATIRRWLKRARDLGYLGEAVPGKAGEAPPRRSKRRED